MRFWLALTGFLLFAAGSAVGVAGARWAVPRHPTHDLSQFLPFNDGFGEREDLLEKLGLSDAQRRKLEELREENKQLISGLREDFIRTSKALQDGIEALLTPEQKEEFENLKVERHRKWTEDRTRRYLARLGENTGMPEDLRAQIFPLIFQAELDKDAVRRACKGEDSRPKTKKISEERDQKIKQILPASYYEKYLEYKQLERRGKGWGRGKDGGRPDGPPPTGPHPGREGKDPAKAPVAP
jgi:Spy/CpxP family protein refolding chaperone